MKKTININLGGMVFQIDEDAYDKLNQYLDALKNKFTDVNERAEIIQDIEYRFAELFNVNITKSNEVVNIDMVNTAISTLGEPEEIEEELENEGFSNIDSHHSETKKRLFRDPNGKVFAGVLSGLSKYFGIQDAIWLRIAFVLLTIASIGIPTVAIYIILWIVMPEAKTASEILQMTGEPINLDNIESQVKKNINSEGVKKTSVKVANKFSELVPMVLKAIAIGLILLFGAKLLAVSFGMLGGGVAFSMFQNEYINLIFDSNWLYYFFVLSFYLMIAIPLCMAIYLAYKLLTNQKINWVSSFIISTLLFILSLIGLSISAFSSINNFKSNAEQSNFVALDNPTVDELTIEFPYEKLKADLNLNISVNSSDHDDDMQIEGIEVHASSKRIDINAVQLDIKSTRNDSIFKLSRTLKSKGKTIKDAEEKLSHITTEFENIDDDVISIPKMLTLENETRWRFQRIQYELFIPIGKRVYFGDNAKKVIDDLEFNGDYSRKNLANNTWEMTKSGLKCISCNE